MPIRILFFTLKRILMPMQIRFFTLMLIRPTFHFDSYPDPAYDVDADPYPAFNVDADPVPAFHSDSDPDPASQNEADPCESAIVLKSEVMLNGASEKLIDCLSAKKDVFVICPCMIQCCGSEMFIPDPNFSIPDPGSRVKKIPVRNEEFKCF
jgi:hypothetical protein